MVVRATEEAITAPTVAAGPAAAPRPLTRRRSLPGSRAVVGGLLVAVAAVGTFAAWSSTTSRPTHRYVVAAHDLTMGSRITAADLRLAPMELPPRASSRSFGSARQLVGATVSNPVAAGELLQASDVVAGAGPADRRQVSFAIDAARAVGGRLAAGDRVDVLGTYGSGEAAYTVTVVRAARIVDTAGSGGSLGGTGTETVTLAVDEPSTGVAVAHAVVSGQVTLVRTADTAPAGVAPAPYRTPAADGR